MTKLFISQNESIRNSEIVASSFKIFKKSKIDHSGEFSHAPWI